MAAMANQLDGAMASVWVSRGSRLCSHFRTLVNSTVLYNSQRSSLIVSPGRFCTPLYIGNGSRVRVLVTSYYYCFSFFMVKPYLDAVHGITSTYSSLIQGMLFAFVS